MKQVLTIIITTTFVGVWMNFTGVNGEPCDSYYIINQYKRSTAFNISSSSKGYLCDKPFHSAWYRFISGAGGKMPEKCPAERSCGTVSPVWLSERHPNSTKVETVRVCARFRNNCCFTRWFIKVKNCNRNGESFFVYYLKPVPLCPLAYCAGKEKKCPVGTASSTGFTPCTGSIPRLRRNPEVIVDNYKGNIVFNCTLDPIHTDINVRHEVTWHQSPPDKQIERIKVLKGDEKVDSLFNEEGERRFRLGKWIYCKVKSYYSGSDIGLTRSSKLFFAGIKVYPSVLKIPEGQKRKVWVESTVPILTRITIKYAQSVFGETMTAENNGKQKCVLTFHPDPSVKYGTKKAIEVAAAGNFQQDREKKVLLALEVSNPKQEGMDWDLHDDIPLVEITRTDVRTSRCISNGDPHIDTFDGIHYHHGYVGEYVLVQSTSRLFQVHVRTTQCGSFSCNCAVAVREDDDVIVIDMCRNKTVRVRIPSKREFNHGTTLKRDKDGKLFEMNFASGSFVRFRVVSSKYYAEVYVQLPASDFNTTSGLCGTYDGNQTNDMITKDGIVMKKMSHNKYLDDFTESWKLTKNKSLFHYKDEYKSCSVQTKFIHYCTCSQSSFVNCTLQLNKQKLTDDATKTPMISFATRDCLNDRKRRSTQHLIVVPEDSDEDIYDFNPGNFTPTSRNYPTPSGITQKQAEIECKNIIHNSTIGDACLKIVLEINVTRLIIQCVFDVLMMDEFTPAFRSVINTLTDQCEEITTKEVTKYWKNDSSGVMKPPIAILSSICPNDCTGKGKCINNICFCNDGFVSADCSIRKGERPVLIGAAHKGLCDIRNQKCMRTRIVGYNFFDSENLQCRCKEVKISSSSDPVEIVDDAETRITQLISFSELSCELPHVPVRVKTDAEGSPGKPTGGFYIEVSNDGTNFSRNRTLFIVYDSKCMKCSKDGKRTCQWKTGTCKINNYCYITGDPNPNNWCEICNATTSNSTFSQRLRNNPPIFKTITKQYAFKGQEWSHLMVASDPEKKGVIKFELVGDSNGMEISEGGNLTWFPQNYGKSYKIRVKASDICGKSSQYTFEVETKKCPCEGFDGGNCVWTNELTGIKHKCKCPNGCRGQRCSDDGVVCKIEITENMKKSKLMTKREDNRVTDEHNERQKRKIIIIIVIAVSLGVVLCIVVIGICISKNSSKKATRKRNALLAPRNEANDDISMKEDWIDNPIYYKK